MFDSLGRGTCHQSALPATACTAALTAAAASEHLKSSSCQTCDPLLARWLLLLVLLLQRLAPATGAGTCVLSAGQTRSGQS
jgi:hypothetical protein